MLIIIYQEDQFLDIYLGFHLLLKYGVNMILGFLTRKDSPNRMFHSMK